jgi:RNA polymerase sigma factor (sigma-70 family)
VTVAVNLEPEPAGCPVGDRGSPGGTVPDSDESFEAFFDRLLPRAVSVGRRILGSRNDGEDAAVEGLARAYVRWDELSGASYRDAWVLRVTANAAYDQLRRQVRGRRFEPGEPAPRDEMQAVDLRRTLVPMLRRLSRRQREVVILSYMVGLSHEEIAGVLSCSIGSVKVHARRGLARLRGDLAGLQPWAEEER